MKNFRESEEFEKILRKMGFKWKNLDEKRGKKGFFGRFSEEN